MSINVGEYGIALNLNVNYDLSKATSLAISFIRPDDTVFVGIPTAPDTPVTAPGLGTFLASQYAQYIFEDGDLPIAGEYRVRLTYVDATKRLVSDITSFEVTL